MLLTYKKILDPVGSIISALWVGATNSIANSGNTPELRNMIGPKINSATLPRYQKSYCIVMQMKEHFINRKSVSTGRKWTEDVCLQEIWPFLRINIIGLLMKANPAYLILEFCFSKRKCTCMAFDLMNNYCFRFLITNPAFISLKRMSLFPSPQRPWSNWFLFIKWKHPIQNSFLSNQWYKMSKLLVSMMQKSFQCRATW